MIGVFYTLYWIIMHCISYIERKIVEIKKCNIPAILDGEMRLAYHLGRLDVAAQPTLFLYRLPGHYESLVHFIFVSRSYDFRYSLRPGAFPFCVINIVEYVLPVGIA